MQNSKELTDWCKKEAARNAKMQGDKDHQTARRRNTFRHRNHMLIAVADKIEELDKLWTEATLTSMEFGKKCTDLQDEKILLIAHVEELEARIVARNLIVKDEIHKLEVEEGYKPEDNPQATLEKE